MRRDSSAAVARGDAAMLAEVRDGLSKAQKELPPKFFYDRRGSLLFEEITRLPEYYLTRTERALLTEWMPTVIPRLRPRTLVELGAGSAQKTRMVLDAMRDAGVADVYVPIDVSAAFLEETVQQLRADYGDLQISPAVADIAVSLNLPCRLPHPMLLAFLGSTIGNFEPVAAIRLLRRVRAVMGPADRFLLGLDLKKDVHRIEAAYNDVSGVTAAFNRNMLCVLNRELGADFDPAAFVHVAFYDPSRARIEMHLISTRQQEVSIPGIGVIEFARGETIRTEISCKYDRQSIEALLASAGLRVEAWRTDAEGLYALVIGAPLH